MILPSSAPGDRRLQLLNAYEAKTDLLLSAPPLHQSRVKRVEGAVEPARVAPRLALSAWTA
jgi:hypothetical protein